MERLVDDEVAAVLKRISDRDRKACSEVCRQWTRAEASIRTSLRVLEPESLPKLLQRYPNLTTLEIGTAICDRHLKIAAEMCPSLQTLYLNMRRTLYFSEEFENLGSDAEDATDDGLCSIAFGCRKLVNVSMRRRRGIGDVGITALVSHAKNLAHLDLSWCSKITDTALEYVASLHFLKALRVRGCYLITDRGLASLATGLSSKTLRILDVSECDQITDFGVFSLQQMSCLQELGLAECGPKLTDSIGACVAAMPRLRRLDISWLVNVSDATLIAVAQNCGNLVEIKLVGCGLITGAGIRSFSGHQSLEILELASCCNVSVDDIVHVVLGCLSLSYLGLDKTLRFWMPASMQEQISKFCKLGWR